MLEAEGGSSSVDGETSASGDAEAAAATGASAARPTGTLPSLLGENSHGTLLFEKKLISLPRQERATGVEFFYFLSSTAG